MNHQVTKVHPDDNVLVALNNLKKGDRVAFNGSEFILSDSIPAKHKFVTKDMAAGDAVIMYGVLVGKAQTNIPRGGLISTCNVKHAANSFEVRERKTGWKQPEVSKWKDKTFM